MLTTSRLRTYSLLAAGALLLAAAGCTDSDADSSSSSASSSSSESSSAASSSAGEDGGVSNDELAKGLLPADAFGAGADVVTLDVRDLQSNESGGMADGDTTTPADCADGISALDIDPDDFGIIVAQAASTDSTELVEILAEDDWIDADEQNSFSDFAARCPHVTVTSTDGSTLTLDFRALALPDVGDFSDGISFTTTIQGPDGTNVTAPALMAVAVQDQRMLVLQEIAIASGPLDEAAFVDLYAQAFEAQDDV